MSHLCSAFSKQTFYVSDQTTRNHLSVGCLHGEQIAFDNLYLDNHISVGRIRYPSMRFIIEFTIRLFLEEECVSNDNDTYTNLKQYMIGLSQIRPSRIIFHRVRRSLSIVLTESTVAAVSNVYRRRVNAEDVY